MNLQPAGNEIRLRREDVTILANARDLTGAFELAQRFLDLVPVAAAKAKLTGQLLLVQRSVGWAPKNGEDARLQIGCSLHFAASIEESRSIESEHFRRGGGSNKLRCVLV